MNLANKVITGIWLDIDAAKAGYGAGSTKTVFLRKANYQNGIASGVAGWEYTGDELGTFDGSFYGNYTSYYITGSLFNAMAAYIAAGNNSFTIYNPYASASSHGYSFNYLQWESVVIENPIYIGVYHIIYVSAEGMAVKKCNLPFYLFTKSLFFQLSYCDYGTVFEHIATAANG